MARTHARIYTKVWQDRDFLALTPNAQRLYMLICSQPTLSWAGVIAYTPKRWAGLAAGCTAKQIATAATELAHARFVLIDEDTEELWVRTFVRHDGVLKVPQLKRSMFESLAAIQSQRIRDGFAHEYPHLSPDPEPPDDPTRSDTGPETGPPTGPDTGAATLAGKGIKVVSSSSPSPASVPPAVDVADTSSRGANTAAEQHHQQPARINVLQVLDGGAA